MLTSFPLDVGLGLVAVLPVVLFDEHTVSISANASVSQRSAAVQRFTTREENITNALN